MNQAKLERSVSARKTEKQYLKQRATDIQQAYTKRENQVQLNKQRYEEEFALELQMKHEREEIKKQDRIKLLDQLQRKLSYKKEVVLQKHLCH